MGRRRVSVETRGKGREAEARGEARKGSSGWSSPPQDAWAQAGNTVRCCRLLLQATRADQRRPRREAGRGQRLPQKRGTARHGADGDADSGSRQSKAKAATAPGLLRAACGAGTSGQTGGARGREGETETTGFSRSLVAPPSLSLSLFEQRGLAKAPYHCAGAVAPAADRAWGEEGGESVSNPVSGWALRRN